MSLFVEATVTVMEADSHLQIDPTTVCMSKVFPIYLNRRDVIAHGQHKNYA